MNEHFKSGGCSINLHSGGQTRDVVATGTIGRRALTQADLQFADIGVFRSGQVKRCIGTGC